MSDMNLPPIDPMGWMLGILSTITLGWVGTTSKKVSRHEVEIAVLKNGQANIERSLERLEDHFGTKPQE